MHRYVVLILLIAAGIKFSQPVTTKIDIHLFDETSYLDAGYNLFVKGFPTSENSPLYALWYNLLSHFESNKIALYFLNYKVITILVSVTLFTLLRTYRVGLIVSFLVSLWILICQGNILVWPKVEHLALVVLLISLVVISYVKDFSISLLICSFASLLASYIHPEYFLSYFIFLATYVVLVLLKRISTALLPLTIFIGSSILSLVMFGPPAFFSGDNRAFTAFAQHFAVNWVRWEHSNILPMFNWPLIIKHVFSDADSIVSALKNNPASFLRHGESNLFQLFVGFPKMFSVPVFSIFQEYSSFVLAQLVVLACFTCVYVMRRRKAWIEQAKLNINVLKPQLFAIGVHALVLIVVCLVIFPRDHYVFVLATLLFASIFLCFAANQKLQSNALITVSVCALLFLLTPQLNVSERQETLKTLRFIESLKITKNVNLLESDGGYSTYLPSNYKSILGYKKKSGFNAFQHENEINMIVLSSRLENDLSYKNDAEWQLFLRRAETSGYKFIKTVGRSPVLIVHSSLLSN